MEKIKRFAFTPRVKTDIIEGAEKILGRKLRESCGNLYAGHCVTAYDHTKANGNGRHTFVGNNNYKLFLGPTSADLEIYSDGTVVRELKKFLESTYDLPAPNPLSGLLAREWK